MKRQNIILKKANIPDYELIKKLLSENDLPNADVEREDVSIFIAYEDAEFIGIIGLETFGNIGFLRSMVIGDKYKHKGYGRKVCEMLLEQSRSNGLKEIYLLSKDAANFFEHIGFKRINRDEAPDAIKATRQFNGLCPSCASCLKIKL